MDSYTVGESTEADGRIIPDKVPGNDLIPENVHAAADTFSTVSSGMRTNTETITSLWSGIPAVYEAPTADIVYAAMSPVSTEATAFADKADKVATALHDFADNIATVKKECDTLRDDAQAFRDEIDGGVWISIHDTTKYEYLGISTSNATADSTAGSYHLASGAGMSPSQGLDYLRGKGETVTMSGGSIMILSDWKESSEHVDKNNRLLDRAAEVSGKISGFEADCANTINGQRDSCVAEVIPVEPWMLKQDGDNTIDLPWGHRTEEDRNCGESFWYGVGTTAGEGLEALGGLAVGYNPLTGGWWDTNKWGEAWVGLGTGLGGLLLSTSGVAQIAGLFPGPLQTVMQDVNKNSLDMLKGLVAWDEWSKNPGEAAGITLFNVATLLAPGPKGLGGLLKGTTIGGKLDNIIDAGTKTADDVIANADDLVKKPDFDLLDIDVPDFDRPHLDSPDGPRDPIDAFPESGLDTPSPGDKQHGVDRGDGRDDYGHYVGDNGGSTGPAYLKEQQGLAEIADDFGVDVIDTKVKAMVNGGNPNGRFFDGFFENADGTYTAIEVKSGSASRNAAQETFDAIVNSGTPATATLNGKTIHITGVILKEVP